MNKDQVKLIKEAVLKDRGDGKPIANTLSVLFNNEVTFRNSDDYMIWDDENELVHVVKINMDGPRQSAIAPFRIATGCFGNIQFLEGLYTMRNFEKAIDELFLKTGLITQEKKDMIMQWANGIRNNMSMPSNPGPYYPEGPMIPPAPPKPDRRPGDGIFHGAPIDQRTKENKIRQMITPLIEANAEMKQVRPNEYEIITTDTSSLPDFFVSLIKAVPEKDLFWASCGNGKLYAEFNYKITSTVTNFPETLGQLLPSRKGDVANFDLYIEAYGVRVRYKFRICLVNDDAADEAFVTNTTQTVREAVKGQMAEAEGVTSTSISGYNISVVINNSEADLGLDQILAQIDHLQSAKYICNGQTIVYSAENIEDFKKGVQSTMPTENNQVNEGVLEVTSDNGVKLTYTLKVKYYNEESFMATVNGEKYESVKDAITAANAVPGTTVQLLRNATATGTLTFENGTVLDLNGNTLTSALPGTTISIKGDATIKNGNIVATDNGNHYIIVQKNGTSVLKDVEITGENVMGISVDHRDQSLVNTMKLENAKITAMNAVTVFGVHSKAAESYDGYAATVTVDGECELTGITGFGLVSNGAAHNVKIDVADGAKINGKWGVYAPADGDYNFGKAIITGSSTGIEIRAGRVHLNGTTVVSEGEAFEEAPNGSGSTISGVGIAVSQHTTNLPTSLTVENATVSGLYAVYEKDLQDGVAQGVSLDIQSGTYNTTGNDDQYAPIYSANCTAFVHEGVKSNKKIDDAYIVAGFESTQDEDGEGYTVNPKAADEAAAEEIKDIFENLGGDLKVEADESDPEGKTYNITTDSGSIAKSGIFEQIAAIDNVTKITVTKAGDEAVGSTVEYVPDGEMTMDSFKAAVDALVPKTYKAGEVTLTLNVEVG